MACRWFTTLFAVLALCSSLSAEPRPVARGSAFTKLRPVRLSLPSLKKGSITQFLAADRKGRLYLLRGDTLEVFRLHDGAEMESIGKLACQRSREGAYAAAMDPSGSTWAVSGTAFDLALCDFKEQKRPDGLAGFISSVTFSGTQPLVAVAGGGSRPDLARPISPRVPRVFGLEGSRWKPVSWAALPELEDPSIGVMTQIKAQTDSLICSGPKRSIWLASWNAYRLQEVSDTETPKREVVVGSPKVKWAERAEKEQGALNTSLKKQGLDPKKNRSGQVYPENVIRANLCGRDGLIYLLVTTGDGIALDRFDPTVNTLERVLLDGVKVGGGPMTAVLGSGELVMGGRFTEDGLWRISLEDLASASWKPVPGARVNGKPIH